MKLLAIPGSLRRASLNRALLVAAAELVPDDVTFTIDDLRGIPLYDGDLDDDELRPAEVNAFKQRITEADAVLIATPEYNYGIPGVLKNAIDWASRPYGTNSFARKPSAMIGTSPGKIGTAVGQQHLRSILAFCNSPQFNAIEAYIEFTKGLITDDGEVTNDSTKEFLATFMGEYHGFVSRVYTAIPRTTQA